MKYKVHISQISISVEADDIEGAATKAMESLDDADIKTLEPEVVVEEMNMLPSNQITRNGMTKQTSVRLADLKQHASKTLCMSYQRP